MLCGSDARVLVLSMMKSDFLLFQAREICKHTREWRARSILPFATAIVIELTPPVLGCHIGGTLKQASQFQISLVQHDPPWCRNMLVHSSRVPPREM